MKNNDAIIDVGLFEKNDEEMVVVFLMKSVKVFSFVKGKGESIDLTYNLVTENPGKFSRVLNVQYP